ECLFTPSTLRVPFTEHPGVLFTPSTLECLFTPSTLECCSCPSTVVGRYSRIGVSACGQSTVRSVNAPLSPSASVLRSPAGDRGARIRGGRDFRHADALRLPQPRIGGGPAAVARGSGSRSAEHPRPDRRELCPRALERDALHCERGPRRARARGGRSRAR